MEILALLSPEYIEKGGIIVVLVAGIRYFVKELENKDKLVEEIRADNTELLKTTNNLTQVVKNNNEGLKRTYETIDEYKQYIEYGKFWIKTHKPTMSICTSCTDYDKCPHPKKPYI